MYSILSDTRGGLCGVAGFRVRSTGESRADREGKWLLSTGHQHDHHHQCAQPAV